MKTNGEVCRGFLVWLDVRAFKICNLPIRDEELALESEREKRILQIALVLVDI